jgi:hypothetical protein
MEREALKLALEALENMCDTQSNPDRRNFPTIHDYGKAQRACIAIKAALAQPAQEPVAWRWGIKKLNGGHEWRYTLNKTRPNSIPLYAAPQKRNT